MNTPSSGTDRDPDRLPDSSDPSGPCPRCGRPSNFVLRETTPVTYKTDMYADRGPGVDPPVVDQQLAVMECAYCQQNIVVIEDELHDAVLLGSATSRPTECAAPAPRCWPLLTCTRRVAMRILRHSKIAVTMEICTEVPDQAAREALRRLGEQFAS
jgi:hypothetical protein